MTNAPIVIKDKVIAGISGGEFGVRGRVTAYDVNTGKHSLAGYSTGPDSEVLIEGDANANYPSHKGKDLGVSTWQGDEWKRGGGTTWGWYSYDPELNLFYYGTGNPGSWNPDQRPGDNKWSMTIFARNPDTGKAAWAYQKTPHDEWDYDGVNENVLFDEAAARSCWCTSTATASPTRSTAPTASCSWPSPSVRSTGPRGIDLKTGMPVEGSEVRHLREEEHQGHLPVGDGRQGPAAGGVLADAPGSSTSRPTTSAWTTRAWR